MILFLLGWMSHPLAAVVCAVLARRHSYSATGPACAGLVLGLGAIPLIWLLTRQPRPLGVGSGLAPGLGLNPVDPQNSSDKCESWRHFYLGIRLNLALSTVMAIAVVPLLALLLLSYIVPTFVVLFEGMSLELPLPTRILIFLTKFLRQPLGMGALLVIQWSWPALSYWLLTRSYRLPFLSPVWRHADRIWLLLSQERDNFILPAEVLRRTRNQPVDWDPSAGEVDRQMLLHREHDLLEASIKRSPLFKLAVLTWALLFGILILSLFLPMYQLIGNIGN